jgi:hypothetical protein
MTNAEDRERALVRMTLEIRIENLDLKIAALDIDLKRVEEERQFRFERAQDAEARFILRTRQMEKDLKKKKTREHKNLDAERLRRRVRGNFCGIPWTAFLSKRPFKTMIFKIFAMSTPKHPWGRFEEAILQQIMTGPPMLLLDWSVIARLLTEVTGIDRSAASVKAKWFRLKNAGLGKPTTHAGSDTISSEEAFNDGTILPEN